MKNFLLPKRGITSHCRTLEDFNKAVGTDLATGGIGTQCFKTIQAFGVLAPHLSPCEEGTTVQFTQTRLYLMWTACDGRPCEIYWDLMVVEREFARVAGDLEAPSASMMAGSFHGKKVF